MYCKKCGKELVEGARFCSECGEPAPINKTFEGLTNEEQMVEEPAYVDPYAEPVEEPVKKHVPRCFTVFGNVGYILALVGFICSFIPVICVSTYQASLVGLVFSILGKRDPELANKTKKGRVFGILGLVFGFIMIIVTILVLGWEEFIY